MVVYGLIRIPTPAPAAADNSGIPNFLSCGVILLRAAPRLFAARLQNLYKGSPMTGQDLTLSDGGGTLMDACLKRSHHKQLVVRRLIRCAHAVSLRELQFYAHYKPLCSLNDVKEMVAETDKYAHFPGP
jgi:hypothetical protein